LLIQYPQLFHISKLFGLQALFGYGASHLLSKTTEFGKKHKEF
jgi:hypothetical protein